MTRSGVEKSAKGLSKGGLGELRHRLFVVLFGILIYRLGAYIPVPGLDPARLAFFFKQHESGLLGLFNMFSGGAFSRLTIFALGIMPYISASIIVQMFSAISPKLKELKKEGDSGRRQITQYTRYATVFLACIQSMGITKWLVSNGLAYNPSPFFYVQAILTLTAGTVFLMWLGEQMTERGIGNGISLIIFASIVSRFPSAIGQVFTQVKDGQMSPIVLFLIVAVVAAVTIIVVYFERAQRRIPITYPSRQQGRKMMSGQNSHLPLKINMAGVIPPIFAQSIILFPATIAQFMSGANGSGWLSTLALMFSPGQPLYLLFFAAAVIFFAFFYTALMFHPKDTADNLKKSGAFIPGIRPGHQTTEYIDGVMTRLTLVGSIYLALVALLPQFLIMAWHVPFYFGGTSLLIIVVVVMDFISQVQAHLMAHQYQSLMSKTGQSGSDLFM